MIPHWYSSFNPALHSIYSAAQKQFFPTLASFLPRHWSHNVNPASMATGSPGDCASDSVALTRGEQSLPSLTICKNSSQNPEKQDIKSLVDYGRTKSRGSLLQFRCGMFQKGPCVEGLIPSISTNRRVLQRWDLDIWGHALERNSGTWIPHCQLGGSFLHLLPPPKAQL